MSTQETKPTVWLVNESGHEYTDAQKFGSIRAITVSDVNPFNVDRLLWKIAHVVTKLTKREDYLLISGTAILTGLAMSVWLKAHDQCKILQWHARERIYIESVVTRDQMDNLVQKVLEGRWTK